MLKVKFRVDMDCATCAGNIDKTFKKMGITSVSNAALKITKLEYDETKYSLEEILKTFKGIGYNATKV